MSKRAAMRVVVCAVLLSSACSSGTVPDPDPGQPANPGPGTPGTPGMPGQPGVAGTPANPGTPRDAGTPTIPEPPLDPGTVVALELPASDQAALAALDSELAPLKGLDASGLAARHPITFDSKLGYDPRSAKNLELIQASAAALNDQELNKLATQGFAISPRQQYANMAYGYKTIYALDLPVYISLDSILDAVHQSYDQILESLEQASLIPDLHTLLALARKNLASGVVTKAQTREDLDSYLAVALALLDNNTAQPVAGADATRAQDIVTRAMSASGIQKVVLFGTNRELDFSQFKPRGHYNDSPQLQQYFRAMMWLGRTDFRLIETLPTGERVFHRRQLDAVLALHDLVNDLDAYNRIDAVVSAFVGEHDYLHLAQVGALMQDLGVSMATDSIALSDQEIAQLIIDKGYGAQRIASQVIYKEPGPAETFPLDRSFALLGQRYVIDSHVFSNVTYDRVAPTASGAKRNLPDPLDVAYAALGNAAAIPILASGLNEYEYAPELERTRLLVDKHGDEFWQENLYNAWLAALRSISPAAISSSAKLPAVTRSEAWSKRILNTQLGSWSQLRHDTILYAKQSYTAGASCEFPDAYVDPYPEAFARLASYAKLGQTVVAQLPPNASSTLLYSVGKYFMELESVSNILRDMADQQQKGVPFNAAQMAFVNDAVKSSIQGCTGPATYTGWFARLLFNPTSEMAPTIADVHTDPGDDTHPPQVLHVAAGLPRFMVVTIDTCMGPRAYAGVAYAYHEVVTDLNRLTDQEWAPKAMTAADVPWMTSVLK
jgi:hypothetical protein